MLNRTSASLSNKPHVQQASASTPSILLVPGLNGSPEGHWQTLWEKERNDCRRADLGHWDNPNRDSWIERLNNEITALDGPVILVAHSLGCIATVLWSQTHFHECQAFVRGMLLVAPCDPEANEAHPTLQRFAPIPKCPLAVRSILVASTNDPYAPLTRALQMAKFWGSEFVNIGAVGHINADSGLAEWPYGQTLAEVLLRGPRPGSSVRSN